MFDVVYQWDNCVFVFLFEKLFNCINLYMLIYMLFVKRSYVGRLAVCNEQSYKFETRPSNPSGKFACVGSSSHGCGMSERLLQMRTNC